MNRKKEGGPFPFPAPAREPLFSFHAPPTPFFGAGADAHPHLPAPVTRTPPPSVFPYRRRRRPLLLSRAGDDALSSAANGDALSRAQATTRRRQRPFFTPAPSGALFRAQATTHRRQGLFSAPAPSGVVAGSEPFPLFRRNDKPVGAHPIRAFRARTAAQPQRFSRSTGRGMRCANDGGGCFSDARRLRRRH
jgi:hypothetical protein